MSDSTTKPKLGDMTQEEIIKSLEVTTGHSADELLAMDEKAFEKVVSDSFELAPLGVPPSSEQANEDSDAGADAAAAPAAPPAVPPPANDADAEVSVAIKPSVLGKYAEGGKDLKTALSEFIADSRQAKDTADLLSTKAIPQLQSEIDSRETRIASLSTENESLKSALEQLRAAKPTQPAPGAVAQGDQAAAAADDVLPEIPTMPEDYDPFNEEHQKLITAGFAAMKKRDEILMKRLEKPAAPPVPPPAAPASAPSSQQQGSEQEFNTARQLQSDPSNGEYFRTSMDIAAVNQSYVEFGTKLARIAGIQTPLAANGQFTPETLSVVQQFYGNSQEGQQLKAAAASFGIVPPNNEDLQALGRASAVLSLQRSRFTIDQTGKNVPISVQEAVAIVKANQPHLFNKKDPVASRREELEAIERAQRKSTEYSTEVPPSIGADPNDLTKIPIEVLDKIVAKPPKEWTTQERQLVEKTAKNAGMTNEELLLLVGPAANP